MALRRVTYNPDTTTTTREPSDDARRIVAAALRRALRRRSDGYREMNAENIAVHIDMAALSFRTLPDW